MNKFAHLRLICAGLFLALAFSAALPVSALADKGTPPTEPAPLAEEAPDEEAPVEEAATEEGLIEVAPVEESVQETPAADEEIPDEPSVPLEESTPVEQEPTLLSELPEGIEVVVLDEQGDTVALASTEAAEIIAVADPIWCPASVATPVSGPGVWVGGCSPSQTSFNDLLTWLAANNPNVAGTIWLEKTYDSGTATGTMNDAGDTLFSLDGTTLTNMAPFALP
jgi:hypothetical protein